MTTESLSSLREMSEPSSSRKSRIDSETRKFSADANLMGEKHDDNEPSTSSDTKTKVLRYNVSLRSYDLKTTPWFFRKTSTAIGSKRNDPFWRLWSTTSSKKKSTATSSKPRSQLLTMSSSWQKSPMRLMPTLMLKGSITKTGRVLRVWSAWSGDMKAVI